MGNDLADHGVIVDSDLGAFTHTGVDTQVGCGCVRARERERGREQDNKGTREKQVDRT
jgi:hypothetical protein